MGWLGPTPLIMELRPEAVVHRWVLNGRLVHV